MEKHLTSGGKEAQSVSDMQSVNPSFMAGMISNRGSGMDSVEDYINPSSPIDYFCFALNRFKKNYAYPNKSTLFAVAPMRHFLVNLAGLIGVIKSKDYMPLKDLPTGVLTTHAKPRKNESVDVEVIFDNGNVIFDKNIIRIGSAYSLDDKKNKNLANMVVKIFGEENLPSDFRPQSFLSQKTVVLDEIDKQSLLRSKFEDNPKEDNISVAGEYFKYCLEPVVIFSNNNKSGIVEVFEKMVNMNELSMLKFQFSSIGDGFQYLYRRPIVVANGNDFNKAIDAGVLSTNFKPSFVVFDGVKTYSDMVHSNAERFNNFFGSTPPVIITEWLNQNDTKYVQQFFSDLNQPNIPSDLIAIHNKRLGGIYYYLIVGDVMEPELSNDEEGDWDDF